MRWWGWGEDGQGSELPGGAESMLREAFGVSGDRTPPVSFEEVELPEPADLSALPGEVRTDREARVTHAVGRSYPDLVRIRSGDGSGAPDGVAYPRSEEDVRALLAACEEAGVAVIPFGGGTSVVGGIEALKGGHRAALSMDLTEMRALDIDEMSLTATAGPGWLGPALEEALGERGYTLGHFPQSFEYASLGGFVATRSAGQASTGYGRIDELVLGVRMACPAGELVTRPFPGTAAGPRLRELAVGSEGVLGVITEATLRIRPVPEAKVYEAWRFGSFAEGAAAYRAMEQAEASGDVCRLSDEAETALSLALAGSGEELEPGGSLAILGFEGETAEVEARRERAATFLTADGARPLGTGPGEAWARGRFRAPYLRDDLLDRGVMVETLETSTWWSNLDTLYAAVGDALREALGQAVVMCHISHLYPSGASLYFTFITAQDRDDPLAQWRAAKGAACDAISASGGTITHHHAVGADHAPWMAGEVGETGLEVLRAAKERLDPAGIMNPGKLLPGA